MDKRINKKTYETSFMPFEKQLKWYWRWLGFKYIWTVSKKCLEEEPPTIKAIYHKLCWFNIVLKYYIDDYDLLGMYPDIKPEVWALYSENETPLSHLLKEKLKTIKR